MRVIVSISSLLLLLVLVLAVGRVRPVAASRALAGATPMERSVAGKPAETPAACMQKTNDTERAWCLFDALIGTTGSDPLWVKWNARPSTGMNDLCQAPRTAEIAELAIPTQFLAARSPMLRAKSLAGNPLAGTPLVPSSAAAVHFNPEMYQDLCSLVPASGSAHPFDDLLSGEKSSLDVPARNDVQIIVKTVFAVVPAGLYSGYPFRVWVGADSAISGISGYASWKTTATLDTTPNKPCSNVPGTVAGYQRPQPIPASCFYMLPAFTQADVDVLSNANLLHLHEPAPPVFLLLVGFHVMARAPNQKHWTWQTYWWTASQHEIEDHGRSNADPRWSHFVARAGTDSFYNPYLEGVFPGGAESNCAKCHGYAVYNKESDAQIADNLFHGEINCALNQPPAAGVPCDHLNKMPLTDSLWSLADINTTSAGAVIKVMSRAAPVKGEHR